MWPSYNTGVDMFDVLLHVAYLLTSTLVLVATAALQMLSINPGTSMSHALPKDTYTGAGPG